MNWDTMIIPALGLDIMDTVRIVMCITAVAHIIFDDRKAIVVFWLAVFGLSVMGLSQ